MYEIETYSDVLEQIAALPHEALLSYAEVIGLLELAPWSGEPYSASKPDGAMRALTFGPDGLGLVIYLVLEQQRRVDVLRVHWLG